MSQNNIVVASAARTTTGTSSAIDAPDGGDLCLSIVTTAASGTTPTLDVTVEWSPDGGTSWAVADTSDAFTQITGTANGVRAKRFTVKGTQYRTRWTIGGTTPSFTFSVVETTF